MFQHFVLQRTNSALSSPNWGFHDVDAKYIVLATCYCLVQLCFSGHELTLKRLFFKHCLLSSVVPIPIIPLWVEKKITAGVSMFRNK